MGYQPVRQPGYRKPENPSAQDDVYRQDNSRVYRQGSAPPGRKITIEVITGGPVHGGSVNGAKKSLSEYKHIVNALGIDERPRPNNIPSVSFSEADAKGVVFPHDDPLVLILSISGCDVKRVLIDGGSSANILFARAFDAMMIGRIYLTPVSYPVIGFNSSTVRHEGSIVLQT
uniref:Gag-pol polyprotein n=1 Tax=Chenopodium quinoa TaxID=63459 RepID=A0A803LGI5_CHEQI